MRDDGLKQKIAEARDKRAKEQAEKKIKKKAEPPPVTAGPVDKIVDVLVNPSPGKLLEVTDLDRNQVTIIPTLSVMDDLWDYCAKAVEYNINPVAYRENHDETAPEAGNPIDTFITRLAQCRRSLNGRTQKSLEDIALAELETRNNADDMGLCRDFED